MTMFIIIVPYFSMLVIITLVMGIADGCFVSVMGPIAFDLCGQKGAAQAIGCILGLCSIPLTVGPPIAGKFNILLLNLNIEYFIQLFIIIKKFIYQFIIHYFIFRLDV